MDDSENLLKQFKQFTAKRNRFQSDLVKLRSDKIEVSRERERLRREFEQSKYRQRTLEQIDQFATDLRDPNYSGTSAADKDQAADDTLQMQLRALETVVHENNGVLERINYFNKFLENLDKFL